MKCPNCPARPGVENTRDKPDGSRYRRYHCECGGKFTTKEIMIDEYKKMAERTNYLEDLHERFHRSFTKKS